MDASSSVTEKEDRQQQVNAMDSYKRTIAKQEMEIKQLKSTIGELEKHAQSTPLQQPMQTMSIHQEEGAAARKLVESLQLEVASWKAKYEAAKSSSHTSVAAHDGTVQNLNATIAGLHEEVQSLKEKSEESQAQLDDLLVCLAELDMEKDSLRKRLKALGQVVSDDDDEEDNDEAAEQQEGGAIAAAAAAPSLQ